MWIGDDYTLHRGVTIPQIHDENISCLMYYMVNDADFFVYYQLKQYSRILYILSSQCTRVVSLGSL